MKPYQKPHVPKGKPKTLKRVIRYCVFLLIWWVLLWFVVIPWDSSDQIPDDSYALIEGQRAYAEMIRRQRPNLVTVIRGLNMVKTEYTHEVLDDSRSIAFGNIVMFFEPNGDFRSLRILHE